MYIIIKRKTRLTWFAVGHFNGCNSQRPQITLNRKPSNTSQKWSAQKYNQHRFIATLAVCDEGCGKYCITVGSMGGRTYGQMGSADLPEKWTKNKKAKNMHKKSSFLRLCYILRAIRAGRCRERRYADHTFIQIYCRMHHSVVKFSQFSSPQAAREHWPPNQNPADVPGWYCR